MISVKLVKKDSQKAELIKHLLEKDYALLFFYDEEPEGEFPCEQIKENTYLVSTPYDYDELCKWLYLGNWQAIFPANADYEPFDTFKTTKTKIEQHMKETKLELIIDSFHDNIEWNVIERMSL